MIVIINLGAVYLSFFEIMFGGEVIWIQEQLL